MTTILSRGSLNFWVAVIGGASLVAQTPEQTEFFEKKIRPVLVKNCQGCHNPKVKTSGLDMSSSAGFFAGAAGGSLIDKAKPSDSMLLQVISYERRPKMPPMGKMPIEAIADIAAWVNAGPDAGASGSEDSLRDFRLTDVAGVVADKIIA